jgi:hypothetical protein
MLRFLLITLALTTSVSAVSGGIQLERIQAAFTNLGNERRPEYYAVDDGILFRFVVRGAKVDEEGQVHLVYTVAVTDAQGKPVHVEKHPADVIPVGLGSQSCLTWTGLVLHGQFTPGDYQLAITVQDQLSSDEASFTRSIKVKPNTLGIRYVRFYSDPEWKHEMSSVVRAGQPLFFRAFVGGLDKGQPNVDVTVTGQVFNNEGKAFLPRPFVKSDKKAAKDLPNGQGVESFSFDGKMPTYSPGEYRLVITMTDNITRQTATIEEPITITLP